MILLVAGALPAALVDVALIARRKEPIPEPSFDKVSSKSFGGSFNTEWSRPLGLTIISVLWGLEAVIGLSKVAFTLGRVGTVFNSLFYLSVVPSDSWVQWAIPGYLLLWVLTIVFYLGLASSAYGFWKGIEWSTMTGIATPMLGFLLNVTLIAFDYLAPGSAHLRSVWVLSIPVAGATEALFWTVLNLGYLRRPSVRRYLSRWW